MIESYKHFSEEQKEIVQTWLGTDVRLISKNDTLIFKADIVNTGLDRKFLEGVQKALSEVFPRQNIVVLPIDMNIEIFKEV